ncbi:hypothetical protein D3874_21355 [Oleomonas cavernae]|uniref:Conjugative relaxase n=1 Tax=Oleomonas cavernae TaxID=2320859 RepID=A0A418WGN9_9PROT|nr:MobF family relaxase [Oleomonas cavernae]RJF89204.1 hypothetical protein D3874_21355 [Oleomonas cavernae]
MMVVTVRHASGADYYLDAPTLYYLEGQASGGYWVGFGATAAALGLRTGDAVQAKAFERVFQGLDPASGEELIRPYQGRREAEDATHAAPKSVSVLRGLGSPAIVAQIDAAQSIAVQASLEQVFDRHATSRRGKQGQDKPDPADLIVAVFPHGDARPTDGSIGDPHLHSHAVIMNLSKGGDGKWRAIDGETIYDHQREAGSVYRLTLARELQARLGVEIVPGKHGLFELAGIPQAVIDALSKRGNEIDRRASAARQGLQQRKGRRPKGSADEALQRLVWCDEVVAQGFSPDGIVRDTVGRQPAARPLPDWEAVADAVTATDSCPAKRVVRQHINEALVGCDLGGLEPQALQQQVIARHFIDLEAEGDRRSLAYTTQRVLEAERRITQIAPRLAARMDRRLAPVDVEAALFRANCDGEQSRTVRAVTGGGDLVVIEGPAGAGKTTLLKPVIEAYLAAGYAPIVTGPAWKVAQSLGEATGAPYEVLANLAGGKGDVPSRIGPASIVVVDESGMVGAPTMAAVLDRVEHAGAKVILVGDRQQLQPVEAGPALSLLLDHVPRDCYTEVKEVRRQRSATDRVQALRWRDQSPDSAEAAIEHARETGTWHAVDTPETAVDTAVDLWSRLERDDEHVLLLARSNLEARVINERIRALRRRAGQIGGEDYEVVAADQSGNLFALALACGDRIRLTRKIAGRKGLVNGTEATITAITMDETKMLTITMAVGGETVSVTERELRHPITGGIKLAHAYASTVHAAQGATVDHAIIVAAGGTRRWDANLAYVAASRHRDECHWVVNEAPARMPRNGRDPDEGEVTKRLAADLARPAEKASALLLFEQLIRLREKDAAVIEHDRPNSLNFLASFAEDRFQDKVANALLHVMHNLQSLARSMGEAIERLRAAVPRVAEPPRLVPPRSRTRDDWER